MVISVQPLCHQDLQFHGVLISAMISQLDQQLLMPPAPLLTGSLGSHSNWHYLTGVSWRGIQVPVKFRRDLWRDPFTSKVLFMDITFTRKYSLHVLERSCQFNVRVEMITIHLQSLCGRTTPLSVTYHGRYPEFVSFSFKRAAARWPVK